jgi:tetratricopeptide (TPR) repeat protein
MDTKEKNSFWTRRNIAIIGVGILLFAGAVGAMVWWIMSHPAEQKVTEDQQTKVEAAVAQAKQQGEVRTSAEAAVSKGNVDQANKIYADAIAREADAVRKIELYLDQSGVFYAAGQYKEAFAAAKKAESLTDDKFLVADWLSRLYEDQKDYKDAASYYRLAGTWATSPQNKTALTKAYYDAQAAQMDKLAQGGGQ